MFCRQQYFQIAIGFDQDRAACVGNAIAAGSLIERYVVIETVKIAIGSKEFQAKNIAVADVENTVKFLPAIIAERRFRPQTKFFGRARTPDIDHAADGANSFLSFELGFDAVANNFFVNANLAERVFESTKIAEAAQSLWYRSADAWADHRTNSRVAGSQESPVWAVAYGISSQRNEQFSDPTGLGLGDTNLDYKQDYFGMQGGVDYRIADSLTAGLTGGYINSSFRQDASGNRVDFDVINIGLSASLNAGGFFADALIKYDSISGDLSDPARSGFNGQVDGSAFGAWFETGYRIGSKSFYVEPRVSLDLQKTDLDNLDIEGQGFAFDNLNGVRGATGLRFGGYGKMSGSTKIGYFLDASAVREFDGNADVRFQVGNEVIDFQNDPVGTYAHVEAGVTLDSKGPISGFFQIEGDLSQDYNSFGGKVGLKVKF